MLFSKRGRQVVSIALCVSILSTLLPYKGGTVFAASPTATPTLTAIQSGKYVKLSWNKVADSVEIFRDGQLIYSGTQTNYEDTLATDKTEPQFSSDLTVSTVNRYPQVSWFPTEDVGTTYNYQIQGISDIGPSELSNNVPVTVTSGMKGYSVLVDQYEDTIPNSIVETTGTSYNWPNPVSNNYYVHVVAVDKENNVSSPAHYYFEDVTPPTITITPSTTAWTAENVVLTATAYDNDTGVQWFLNHSGVNSLNGRPSVYSATTNGIYRFDATDYVGNSARATYTVSNIDKVAPSQPTLTLNPSGWSTTSVNVTLTHGTDSLSGVQKSQYKIGSGAWTDYSAPFAVSNEGETVVYARTIDNAGNMSTETSATTLIDTTRPTVPTLIINSVGWSPVDVDFTISNGSDSGSGVEKSQYRLNNGPWIDYNEPVTITVDGLTDVFARTVDKVGNISDRVQGTIRIDKTPPTVPSITLSETYWTKNNVSFTLSGSTDMTTVRYMYKINDGTYINANTGFVTNEGVTTFTAQARDTVGNLSEETSVKVYIDRSKPEISVTPNVQNWTSSDIPVTIAYTDEHSGVNPNKRFYKVTNNMSTPVSWDAAMSDTEIVTIDQEGVWYIHAKVEDIVGNSYETVSEALQLQREAAVPDNLRISQITEDTVTIVFDLPDGTVYTAGTQFEVKNETTNESWTLLYPDHSITDTNLEGGKTYSYTVRAKNHVGESVSSAPVTALTLPRAPESIKIEPVGTDYHQAKVSFDAVESATSYRIVVKDLNDSEVYNRSVTDTVYQPISNLEAGTIYTISISAINASGEGISSKVGYQSLPSAPGNFQAVQIGEQTLTLTWNTVTSATYYSLARNGELIYEDDTATSYIDTGLEPGVAYDYTVHATNETGASEASSITATTLPAKVENINISEVTTSTIKLDWDEVQGANHYVILINGQLYQRVAAGTSTLLVNGLPSGTSHTIDLYAENASGAGQSSQRYGLTLPEQVDGLQATNTSDTSTTLKWNAVTGADRYLVEVDGQSLPVTGVEAVITGLSGGHTYTFKVTAGNTSGYGQAAEASFLTAPNAPNEVEVTETTETSIDLQWEEVDTATSYIVFQDEVEKGRISTTAYTLTGLEPGTPYLITVHAVNATGTSSATPLTWITKPSAPEDVEIAAQPYEAHVSWTPVQGATSYKIMKQGESTILYQGAENEFTLTGLSDGTNYSYSVYAMNANGVESNQSTFNVLTLAKKPAELGFIDVQMNQLTLDLSKTNVVGADRYLIKRDGVEVGTPGTDETSFTDENLLPGTKYVYTIQAVNDSGVGEAAIFEVTTKTEAIQGADITIVAGTHNVTVTWEAVQGAATYEIRNTDTGEVITTSNTQVTLSNLLDGSEANFELIVVNGSGVSSSGTTFSVVTKPTAPASVTASEVTDTTATLDLSSSSVRGAEIFIIERDGVEVGRINADQLSFKDVGLTPGASYIYVVKTANDSGTSDEGFSVPVKTVPATVSTSAQVGELTATSVKVSWPAVQGADEYKVMVGNVSYTVTDQTSVTIEGLESATTYDDIKIIPVNTGGEGAAFPVSVFDTLPTMVGFQLVSVPEMDKVTFNWQLPSLNETFVLTYEGNEVYRGTDRSFTLEGLQPGTVNMVTFHTENGSGVKSESSTYAVQTKPEGPIHVGYTSTPSSIELQFEATPATGAVQYVIEQAGVEIGRVSVTAVTFVIPNLSPGTEYTYVVKTANGSGESEDGFIITAKTLPFVLPSQPTSEHITTDGATIKWEPVEGATGYDVYIGEKLVVSTDKTMVKLTDLESALTYNDIRVIPFNDTGKGQAISVIPFETLPSSDFKVHVIANNSHELTFNWELASQNETFVLAREGQELYRGKDRKYLLKDLPAGTSVTLQIWTENASGAKSEVKNVSGKTNDVTLPGGSVGSVSPTPTPKPTVLPTETPSPTPIKEISFEDITTTFNKEQITFLAQQGIIAGVTETRFEPSRAITRAEFTALIVRLMGFETSAYEGNFKDVESDSWYAEYVASGIVHNVIEGMGRGIFAPNQEITREQASVILANVLKAVKGEQMQDSKIFADQERISYWAADRVTYLAGLEMVNGYEDGTFRPLNNLTRAEAAALIYRLNGVK